MSKTLITINRQSGSGGRVIGKALAERLGIPFYDHELISLAAKESGYTESLFEDVDERPSNSFLYSLVTASYATKGWFYQDDNLFASDKLFAIQADVIRKVAQQSCIIVGRCADFLLKDDPDLITLFLYAPIEFRKERTPRSGQNLSDKEVEQLLKKTDRNRANYYNYYTSREWSQMKYYDLCLNTASLGTDGSTAFLERYVALRK